MVYYPQMVQSYGRDLSNGNDLPYNLKNGATIAYGLIGILNTNLMELIQF